jgi:eukaryotic-like serine/threonine-protein kinase
VNANPTLAALAAAVSDGSPVDWQSAIQSASSSAEVRTLESLQLISTLCHLHRSARELGPSEPATASPTRFNTAVPRWGSFVLLERIGSGAYGEVFRALDTRLDREVALKLLTRSPHGNQVAPLLNEARLLARIRHPNVVTVYGADFIDGHIGLSMELISGESLDEMIARRGTMNAHEAAMVGIDLCRAVAAVHSAGLLHRDIKAQNVMREPGGRYVLMDLGTGHEVSDTARGSQRAGTPIYLAPELLRGGAASTRSDVYAIGVLLFYLTSRRFPVRAKDLKDLTDKHASGDQQALADIRPALPKSFHDVVARATAGEPSARFRSASEMADALTKVLPQAANEGPLRRWRPFAIVAASVAASALVWSALSDRSASLPMAAPSPTIAVLPLQDLSQSQTLAHVAAGLTDILITDLGQSVDINVLARTTSKEFVGLRGIAILARDYGVSAVVDGAIQPEGDRLQTSIRVVNATTGAVVWSSRFVHALNDTLRMRQEVAGQIANVLRTRFNQASLSRHSPGMNSQAFEDYFRAWSEYFLLNRASLKNAQDLFEKVIAADDNFAPAHAAVGQVRFVRAASFREWPTGATYAAALEDANRSVELARTLDPQNSYAAAVAGLIRFSGYWDWAGAERAFSEALALNPSDAHARGLYGQLLMAQHRLEGALLETRRAQQLDPLNPTRISQVAICLYYMRRFDESLIETDRLLARDPPSSIGRLAAARVMSALARYDDALAMLSTGGRTQEAPIRAEAARILAVAGREEEAQAALPSLQSAYESGALAPDYLAYVVLALGDRDRAVALLTEAVDQRSASVAWLKVDPRFDALRSDLRFAALVQRIGLEP